MNLAVEDFLSKITPWPKEINSRSTMKQFTHHLILKALSFAVVTPFYAASLVESVQSDVASEPAGIFDVFVSINIDISVEHDFYHVLTINRETAQLDFSPGRPPKVA